MKICPKCGTEQDDSAVFCSNCGNPFVTAPAVTRMEPEAAPEPVQQPVQIPVQPVAPQPPFAPQPPVAPQPQYVQPTYQAPAYTQPVARYNAYDHSDEFDAKDVSDNKPYAMLIYLSSVLGIIVALLASGDSPYLKFHVRQAIKLYVTSALVALLSAVLAWTVIVPIAGVIAGIALLVVNVVCFINVLKNKSIEPAIVRDLKFLK